MIAAQAIDLRGVPRLGRGTQRLYDLVRQQVVFTAADEAPPRDIEGVLRLVRSGGLASLG